MKKRLYTLISLVTLSALCACTTTSQKSGWTLEQRKTMRRALHEYRDMVYIDELTDAEFFIFSDNVIDEVENVYPNYTTFTAMPAVDDTVDRFVTTIIVEQLDADGTNIKHIYPYRELRHDGTLPKGLTRQQQRTYYKCLARAINNRYSNFAEFFNAVAADTTDKNEIAQMQASCAKSLFDWNQPTK